MAWWVIFLEEDLGARVSQETFAHAGVLGRRYVRHYDMGARLIMNVRRLHVHEQDPQPEGAARCVHVFMRACVG